MNGQGRQPCAEVFPVRSCISGPPHLLVAVVSRKTHPPLVSIVGGERHVAKGQAWKTVDLLEGQ